MTLDYSLRSAIDTPLFHLIGEAADELGVEAYVVGGYVRDLLLHRPGGDIDVVSVGRGIDLARAFAKKMGKGGASLCLCQLRYCPSEEAGAGGGVCRSTARELSSG